MGGMPILDVDTLTYFRYLCFMRAVFFNDRVRYEAESRSIPLDLIQDCLDEPDQVYTYREFEVYCIYLDGGQTLKVTLRGGYIIRTYIVR